MAFIFILIKYTNMLWPCFAYTLFHHYDAKFANNIICCWHDLSENNFIETSLVLGDKLHLLLLVFWKFRKKCARNYGNLQLKRYQNSEHEEYSLPVAGSQWPTLTSSRSSFPHKWHFLIFLKKSQTVWCKFLWELFREAESESIYFVSDPISLITMLKVSVFILPSTLLSSLMHSLKKLGKRSHVTTTNLFNYEQIKIININGNTLLDIKLNFPFPIVIFDALKASLNFWFEF